MSIPKFDPKELEVVGYKLLPYYAGPKTVKLNSPISPKENFFRALRKETPYWIPFNTDTQYFAPRIFPDNVVCGLVRDGEEPLTIADYSGKGWFDTEWVFVETVGGATTVPGKQQLLDVNEWKTLRFPDPSSYDWERSAKVNESFFERDLALKIDILCGYWERLMALMDVTDAAMAMIDEDSTDAVHQLFTALTDLYIETVDYCVEAYHPDIIQWHDDWGTQRAPFFAVDTIREMLVPHFKRLVDHVHSKGIFFEFHCCGANEPNVPLMIEAGFDLWNGQDMNDKKKLAKLYSKDIMIGVPMPMVSKEASDEEIKAAAREFFEEYKDLRVYISDYACDPRLVQELYRLGREYYSD